MSITIKKIKTMSENECTLWGTKVDSATNLIIEFLRKNDTEAFDIVEIRKKINNQLKEDKKIKKGSMYHIMKKIILKDKFIQKKGSFFYYEKNIKEEVQKN